MKPRAQPGCARRDGLGERRGRGTTSPPGAPTGPLAGRRAVPLGALPPRAGAPSPAPLCRTTTTSGPAGSAPRPAPRPPSPAVPGLTLPPVADAASSSRRPAPSGAAPLPCRCAVPSTRPCRTHTSPTSGPSSPHLTGRTGRSTGATAPSMPASTLKLGVTATAALETPRVRSTHTFATRVARRRTQPPDPGRRWRPVPDRQAAHRPRGARRGQSAGAGRGDRPQPEDPRGHHGLARLRHLAVHRAAVRGPRTGHPGLRRPTTWSPRSPRCGRRPGHRARAATVARPIQPRTLPASSRAFLRQGRRRRHRTGQGAQRPAPAARARGGAGDQPATRATSSSRCCRSATTRAPEVLARQTGIAVNGDGSLQRAAPAAVRARSSTGLGIDLSDATIYDGGGLSRGDLGSTRRPWSPCPPAGVRPADHPGAPLA